MQFPSLQEQSRAENSKKNKQKKVGSEVYS